MSNDILTFSLVLPEFSIDFDVKKQSSIEWTRRFDSHGTDFVFVVSEIWLRIGYSRHLLVPELHTGNLIELLRAIGETVRNPISVQRIEEIIPCGSWGVWMSGYWERLDTDISTIEDERIYDLLIPLSLIEGREGHIAAYRYNGIPIIEVATRPKTGEKTVYVWSAFDPERMAEEVRGLRQSIVEKLLPEINAIQSK